MRRCVAIVTEHQRTHRRWKILCLICERKNSHFLINNNFLPQSDPLLHPRYRCRGFLLYLIALNDAHARTRAHTPGRTPPDERSARSRDFYLPTHNTGDIHTPGGIWTRNTRKPEAADTRLLPRDHWDRRLRQFIIYKCRGLKASERR